MTENQSLVLNLMDVADVKLGEAQRFHAIEVGRIQDGVCQHEDVTYGTAYTTGSTYSQCRTCGKYGVK